MARSSIDSHNFDEKEITLKDLQENGKEKLADIPDKELQQLKQQAIDAEDYDIAKLIKQEQTERAERAKETGEDVKDEDDLQELEDQTKREEEWKNSKEEDLKKADQLKELLGKSDGVIEKNFPWLTSENGDQNVKDEFMENLGKNQEWYTTLSDDEKKQFRTLYDVSKILDNNQKKIDEYQGNLHDWNWMSSVGDYTGDERKRKDDALEAEAKSIVSDLDKEFSKYSRIYSGVENARVQNLFKLMKYTSNKGLFMETSYTEVLHEMVDILKDIKKDLETEKSFKLAVINIRDIRVPE